MIRRPTLLRLAALAAGAILSVGSAKKQSDVPVIEDTLAARLRARPQPPRPRADAGEATTYGSCPAPRGTLRRSDLLRILDRGTQRFLTGLSITRYPPLGPGTPVKPFQGWRVDRFFPGEPCLARTGVRRGDVIVSINGQSLERPAALHDLWQRLRTAKRLTVRLSREGKIYFYAIAITD